MRSSLLVALASAGIASAHFQLQWPTGAGFDDDKEPTAPCGGFTPDVNSNSPAVSVDQFAVSIYSSHPTGNWSFAASLSTDANSYNLTPIVPLITTTGAGTFCLTGLYAPSSYAGKAGVLQVIDYSGDGTLYQCAAVNFVSGANTTFGAACQNKTGTPFQATWTSQQANLGSSGNSSSSGGHDHGSTTASSAAAATPTTSTRTGGAAVAMITGVGSIAGLGLLAAGLVL